MQQNEHPHVSPAFEGFELATFGTLHDGRGTDLNGHWPDTTLLVGEGMGITEIVGAIAGLRQVGPRHWASTSDASVSYPATGHITLSAVENSSFWFAHRNRVIASLVRETPPGGPVLDVGGGTGFVSAGLIAAGFPSVVVEPGKDGVQSCVSRGVPVVAAPFQDLSIFPGSIPAVGMFDVLEHIEDDAGALSKVHQALAPGGLLYLAVPAGNWLWSHADVQSGHFRRYSKSALKALLDGAGFATVRATYFFSPLVLPLFLLKSLPHRFFRGRDFTQETVSAEHRLPDNFAGRLIDAWLSREASHIEKSGSVPLGTSLFVTARKRAD